MSEKSQIGILLTRRSEASISILVTSVSIPCRTDWTKVGNDSYQASIDSETERDALERLMEERVDDSKE